MTYWNNKNFKLTPQNMECQSSQNGSTNYKINRKAYINPDIVNCEFLKKSLAENFLQRTNKIHVNPNFRRNASSSALIKNDHLSISTQSNSNNLLLDKTDTSYNPSGNYPYTSGNLYSEKEKNPASSTIVTGHRSRFKKINVDLKSSNKSPYSWSPKKHSTEKINTNFKNSFEVSSVVHKQKQKPKENVYKFISSQKQNQEFSNSHLIFKSKTKIINKSKTKPSSSTSPKSYILKDKKTYIPFKKQLSSKFVYIKNKMSPTSKIAKAVRSKYKYLNTYSELNKKSKYKIDKRKKFPETIKKKLNLERIKDIRKLFPKYFNNRVKWPYGYSQLYGSHTVSKGVSSWRKKSSSEVTTKVMNQYPNRRVVKIGGILYKSTTNKLTLANKASPKSSTVKKITNRSKGKKNHIVYVRGEKFILINNGKALRRQNIQNKKSLFSTTKRIDIGGVTYIQKSPNVLIRTNVHRARHLISKAKNKSIAVLASLRKRSSMPCMIYHKFGKCNRQAKGLCIYKHDPKNIAVCKKFLKNTCTDVNCLLSHQVIQEKMATCHFFLNGHCFRENCPFLHVKLNENAAICKDFLQGFCSLGKDCSQKHFNQCPEFDKFGTCSLGSKCLYPHKNLKKTENTKTNQNEPVKTKNHTTTQKRPKGSKKVKEGSTKKPGKRKAMLINGLDQNSDVIECFPKRIKLEKLPCYIPLKSDS